ncbi:MAG: aldo/keto reductase, partial [Planctomycetota bacterium]
KTPTWKELAEGETYRSRMEAGLKRAKTDYFDTYLMHSLRLETFDRMGDAFMAEAVQAKEEGLIRHIGFSSHDKPENIVKYIDTGLFECMLVQYNLIDTHNADVIRYAHEKGLGVSIMGPVGGGRLSTPSEISSYLPGGKSSGPEAALRFVLSNPDVDVVFSGMSTVAQLEENVATASIEAPLTDDERARIAEVIAEKTKLAELYCTGCGYCMPCPNGVNIPRIFEIMNWKRVYGVDGAASQYYAGLVRREADAARCIECGECEPKCPQNIEIIRQLKETHAALS